MSFSLPCEMKTDELGWPAATALRLAIVNYLSDIHGDKLRAEHLKIGSRVYPPTSQFVIHHRDKPHQRVIRFLGPMDLETLLKDGSIEYIEVIAQHRGKTDWARFTDYPATKMQKLSHKVQPHNNHRRIICATP